MHAPLEKELRNRLETAVLSAREEAETAAREAFVTLGIGDPVAPKHLKSEERALRNRLRTRARQLGDKLEGQEQRTDALAGEAAYELWHRMLFARFLAENNLLIYDGIPISLDECRELAKEENKTVWELASELAVKMLPALFGENSPTLQLSFPPNRVRELERIIESLDPATFKASDALGWLYQFWQTDRKVSINKADEKRGAREIPAVTQLFTEPYMVSFLIDNTIGAWHAAQVLGGKIFETEDEARTEVQLPGVPFTYLRLVKNDDGSWWPAAGSFEKFPDDMSQWTLLDPCCGSGHFLVQAFLTLVPMRMARENLDARTAVDRVLSQNLYGLEIDQRCVELAVFALALEAWRYPDAGGYRPLPPFNVACVGISPQKQKSEWLNLLKNAIKNNPTPLLVGSREQIEETLEDAYDIFQNADVLGSLIDPKKQLGASLFRADLKATAETLNDNIKGQTDETREAIVAAGGILKATEYLCKQYTIVLTNVPYLKRDKQDPILVDFCKTNYKDSKEDVATAFLERALSFCNDGGTCALVLPQNWLFLTSYKKLREKLLGLHSFHTIVSLGPGAFETISGEVVKAILICLSKKKPSSDQQIFGIDVSDKNSVADKMRGILENNICFIDQAQQTNNPDSRIVFEKISFNILLSKYGEAAQGISPADLPHYGRCFWEVPSITEGWHYWQGTSSGTIFYGGKSLILWQNDDFFKAVSKGQAFIRGANVLNKTCVSVAQMTHLPCTINTGTYFNTNCSAVIPQNPAHLAAIWCYCASLEYSENVRKIDETIKVTNATLVKVPFDLDRWQQVAQQEYPNGLPKPFTSDPTQWIFHGHPCANVVWDEQTKRLKIGEDRTDMTVLHVAVARLLGYRWPAESDANMELAPEMREVMKRNQILEPLTDTDGIVCIPPVRRELPAADRIFNILTQSFGAEVMGAEKLAELLTAADADGKDLEYWLRNKFFAQHARLFGNRPFIWQIWDGLPDGFSALVNYHRLDRRGLSNLIHNYLGEWIQARQNDVKADVEGAVEKLDAANALKKKLTAIYDGEEPFDIFVRWKPLSAQSCGWDPDLDDGVRLNIRPFATAGVLREIKPPKLNIKWEKDRGTDLPDSPWFNVFEGKRVNDHHLSLSEKKGN